MGSLMKMYGAAASVLVVLVAGCSQQGQEAPVGGAATPAFPNAALQPLAGGIESAVEGGNCSLDTINGQPVAAASLKVGDDATFIGWAGDSEGNVPDDARLVLVGDGGTFAAPVQSGTERPDVVTALGKPGLAQSGFGVATTLSVVPGTYRVSVLMGAPEPVVCHFDVSLVLAGS